MIRDLYFSGGTASFAARFHHRFPKYPGLDGDSHNEVPVAMVALVATAVCEAFVSLVFSGVKCPFSSTRPSTSGVVVNTNRRSSLLTHIWMCMMAM